jgi:hypothetical protein
MAGRQVPGTSSSAIVLTLDVVWRCCCISSGLAAFFLDLGKGHNAGGLKCVAAHRRCVGRPADGGEEAVDERHGAQEGWVDPVRALLPWRRWPPEGFHGDSAPSVAHTPPAIAVGRYRGSLTGTGRATGSSAAGGRPCCGRSTAEAG